MSQDVFILCLVNIHTKESLGVEFCKDAEDLAFKKKMFLDDFGREDHVALQYQEAGQEMASALLDAFPKTL